LLNWAVRYFPILRVLKNDSVDKGLILEIGSGSFGLAHFYRGQVIGCDVNFPAVPEENMLPVRCSGTSLPFADSQFDIVVTSDVLEHVPPHLRPAMIREALRVTHRLAVFAFPCGSDAHLLDENFRELHQSRNLTPPPWLEEHMQYPFPELELFLGVRENWTVEEFGNEHLRFHQWLNRRELSRAWCRVFRVCLRLVPRLLEAALRLTDRAPFYRMIVVVTRRTME
jgi:methyltransferase family protein